MGDSLRAQVAAVLDVERERQGCFQSKLAEAAGLSQKHVSQMLTGKTMGSFDCWQRLADALGVEFFVGLAPAPSDGGAAVTPTYDQAYGIAAARAEGAKAERERIAAILRDGIDNRPEHLPPYDAKEQAIRWALREIGRQT